MPRRAAAAPWSVVTANVNGIRAAARHGGVDWLAGCGADVICLQEVRATREQLDEALSVSPLSQWHLAHEESPDLGRAGVAVLTRVAPQAVRPGPRGLSGQGRWVEVDVDTPVGPLTVVSAYVHAGELASPKQEAKYAFLDSMTRRLEALRKGEREAIVLGDFNIAHHEVDLKNWKGNRGQVGFLEQERAYLDRWFARHWTDLGRAHGGPGPGPYTWWSVRGKAFDTDTGWRIDYAISTSGLAERCQGVAIGRAPSYAERWSDHAPVTVTFA